MSKKISAIVFCGVIGAYFVILVGCTSKTPKPPEKAESGTSPAATSGQNNLSQQEPVKSGEDKERETQNQILLSRVKQREQQMNLLSQELSGHQQKVSSLELEKSQIEAKLRDIDRQTKAFIEENKIAAFCRDVANVSFNQNNRYEEDVKKIAGGITFGCAAGYLSNEKFRNQVNLVISELTKADNYANTLQGQINDIQTQIDAARKLLEGGKAELSRLTSSNEEDQAKLGVPKSSEVSIPRQQDYTTGVSSKSTPPLASSIPDMSSNEVKAVINDPDGYTNLRSGPGTTYEIVTRISDSETFYTVPKENDDWWKVRTSEGKSGYVHRSRIKAQ